MKYVKPLLGCLMLLEFLNLCDSFGMTKPFCKDRKLLEADISTCYTSLGLPTPSSIRLDQVDDNVIPLVGLPGLFAFLNIMNDPKGEEYLKEAVECANQVVENCVLSPVFLIGDYLPHNEELIRRIEKMMNQKHSELHLF